MTDTAQRARPTPGHDSTPRLEMRDISKRYGGVRAIRHADITVMPGTVHALVGENGAGKSTLIKILAGAEQADTGTITIDGAPVSIGSTTDAIGLGVQTVYQEPQLFPELTVAENFFVGREITRGPMIDWRAQAPRMLELLDTVGLDRGVASQPLGGLSIAQQQQVSIAKALLEQASILILDEPSAILTDAEIEVLFGVVRRLAADGVSIIYISHRLDELFRIADAVTIMRDGETVSTEPIDELSVREIAERMVGGAIDEGEHVPGEHGETVLELEGLTLDGAFADVSLSVRAGEVLGLYGLIGSGAAEVGEVVYGMRRATGGRMRVVDSDRQPGTPADAKRRGIRMVPANRSSQGSFSFQSIAFNITVGSLGLLGKLPGWVSPKAERRIADDLIGRLAVKTPTSRQPLGAMSGGNAQKVVLARQIVEQPKLLVLAEPTQGVDVGAKEEIHRIIADLAARGTAVLVITTDLAEVQRISDRVLVFRSGRIAREFPPSASQASLLAAAAGAEDEPVTQEDDR
ncbi:sugar ABC transporter ATP-binding protein [Agrococcus sp. TF02-05]|uniref:sugar ABC transporter ATP-binding protein n=1 Tax=Agrococcus sp. TF02-05 TaxID=2815211 RepID=UPI001AA0CAD7|nr:sugar ABC transporter ATP-binding protein [Agrococcus sp. TF02-05]MBO1771118.1 sugar ABC transporter ATP-binding protein [Agrococcus sp. TF02-05]